MQSRSISTSAAFVLGLFIAIGLIGMGYLISDTVLKVKGMERSVAVKGLSVREVKADIAIFPLRFEVADNDSRALYQKIKRDKEKIISFLKGEGFSDAEISITAPQITDKFAQGYGNNIKFRYVGSVTITLYTKKVDLVIALGQKLFRLNEQGVFANNDPYETRYIYTGLNRIKPQMIEEATKKAREAAEKFAKDSNSRLGPIKRASQGYFSISDRDSNTPYIKKVRVVTNVTYYLE